jgi:hypothetical protein
MAENVIYFGQKDENHDMLRRMCTLQQNIPSIKFISNIRQFTIKVS